MSGSAEISPCGTWRYRLERHELSGRMFAKHQAIKFIMLNPSTANHALDDPTIRRCIRFGCREFALRLVVCNLAAGRATDPMDLLAMRDPIGPENPAALRRLFEDGPENDPIVLAWGGLTGVRWRLEPMITFVQRLAHDHTRKLFCLGACENGEPRHPLFVKKSQPLVPWDVGNWRMA